MLELQLQPPKTPLTLNKLVESGSQSRSLLLIVPIKFVYVGRNTINQIFMTFVKSRYHNIEHKIDCKTPNLIYYIYCDCQFPSDYVGSTKNIEHRWSKHKGVIRNGNWTACVLTRHFGENHSNNIEEAIGNSGK